MPGVFGQLPDGEELQRIRDKVQAYVDKNPNAFWPEDVGRLMREDYYVARFFMHSVDDPGDDQVECAVLRVKKCFEWRKEVNPAAIKEEDLSPVLKDSGGLFIKNHDVDGKPLMVFAIRQNYRGMETPENSKKYFHFFLEQLDRQTPDGMCSVVFELAGVGLKHFEVEPVQYLIAVFKDYYPFALNYILVVGMPWVLNAVWKLIRSWMPPAGQQKTKFLTRATIGEFIPEDQQLVRWGGHVEYEYSFEDFVTQLSRNFGPPSSTVPSYLHANGTVATLTNGHGLEFGSQSQLNDANNESSLTTEHDGKSSSSSNNNNLLTITPSDQVVFETSGVGNNVNLVASIRLKNASPGLRVAFKIKTTNPEKYKVRPCLVALDVAEECEVKIQALAAHLNFNPDEVDPNGKQAFTRDTILGVLKDKFLVTATVLKDDDGSGSKPSYSRLAELMKSCIPETQYRLRCTIADVKIPPACAPGSSGTKPGQQSSQQQEKISSTSSTLASANRQLETLTIKVNRLDASVNELQECMSSMKRLVLIMLLLVVFLQLTIYFGLRSDSSEL